LLVAACNSSPKLAPTQDSGPPTQCTVAGVIYPASTANPLNPCQSCQPLATTTDWSSLPFGTSCGNPGAVCVSGSCLAGCAIDGVFYPTDALKPQAACQSCQPKASSTDWSPLTSAAGSGCDAGDICLSGACQAGCQIAGVVLAPAAVNPLNPCLACNPSADRTNWSALTDGTACDGDQLCMGGSCQAGCLVAGAYYVPMQIDPINACQSCQPDVALQAFSPLTGLPQSGCDAGQVCATGACAGGCFIDNTFKPPGERSPSDNGLCCSPASTVDDWTNAFIAPSPLPTGAGPMAVAVADFNGDGRADLATVNRSDGTVTVYFSASDGGFIGPLVLAVGGSPVAIVAADLNGDKLPDLVVANADDQSVSVLLNAGPNLGFDAQTAYGTLGNPSAVAVADLNGDGLPDLAVTNLDQGTVAILLGAGSGAFEAALVPLVVGNLPQAIVAVDLNGDSLIDLAVANASDGTVDVLLSTGKATFAAAVPYTVGTHPAALAAVDLNGDGRPDLVVANAFDDNLGVLLNNGNGTFPPQTVIGLGVETYSLAIADFNNDGQPDVAIADYNGGRAGVLLNQGKGNLAAPFYTMVGAPFSAFALGAGDLNGDQLIDLAVVGLDDSTLQILINSCP